MMTLTLVLLVSMIALVTFAIVLEVACLREPKIIDDSLSRTGRRLVIGGWLIIFVRGCYVLMTGEYVGWHPLGVLALDLVALGRIFLTAQAIDNLKYHPTYERRHRARG
jgi:hypothetical protein